MSSYSASQQAFVTSVVNQSFIESLDRAISAYNFQPVLPLNCDKSIAVSNLHKSVRRGDVMSALMSTQTLIDLDSSYLFKRLAVLAFEEVGIANGRLCWLTILAASKRVRDTFGQTRLAYYLVTQLAESIKSRAATDIYCLTISDPDAVCCMSSCLNTPVEKLVSISLDNTLSLCHRMSALKVITGFSERQSNGYYRTISKPRIDLLERVCEDMMPSPHYLDAVMLGNGKTEGLNGAILLAAEMLSNSSNAWVIDDEVVSTKYNDINLAALDIYCKGGRSVIYQFVATSKPLQKYFYQHPNKNPARLVGTVLFIIEGSLLYRGLGFIGQQELKGDIEYMELVAAGIKSKAEADELIQLINQEMPLLNNLRISHLNAISDKISNN